MHVYIFLLKQYPFRTSELRINTKRSIVGVKQVDPPTDVSASRTISQPDTHTRQQDSSVLGRVVPPPVECSTRTTLNPQPVRSCRPPNRASTPLHSSCPAGTHATYTIGVGCHVSTVIDPDTQTRRHTDADTDTQTHRHRQQDAQRERKVKITYTQTWTIQTTHTDTALTLTYTLTLTPDRHRMGHGRWVRARACVDDALRYACVCVCVCVCVCYGRLQTRYQNVRVWLNVTEIWEMSGERGRW